MYLKTLKVRNFRGIKELDVNFDKKLNVIIGANGKNKTALLDAIRLFYQLGDIPDLQISSDDFHREKLINEDNSITYKQATVIEITYIFDDLTLDQKGAFYEYLYSEDTENQIAIATLNFAIKENGKIAKYIYSGNPATKKQPSSESFSLFVYHYLEALRDCTRNLLSYKNNLLARVIKRRIEKSSTEENFKTIINQANDQLLRQNEVVETKDEINNNLKNIIETGIDKVGLKIEDRRIDQIVSVIKPYIPKIGDENFDGFNLEQNSLGLNNLIYIATVLSDLAEQHNEDKTTMCSLLIEEPEAHLHPQLQVNLYKFIKKTSESSQVFITTHSPTLTSKIPLDNLILLDEMAYNIGECFKERVAENIIYDKKINKKITDNHLETEKNKLIRYLDVTKSQLFFSDGVLLVEGISETLMLNTFSRLKDKELEKHRIEVVNVGTTAFSQFLWLYNGTTPTKKLPQKIAVITDEDQFEKSKEKEWKIENLVRNNYVKLNELRENITNDEKTTRIQNLESIKNNSDKIGIYTGLKTFEFQICYANVTQRKTDLRDNDLFKYLKNENNDDIKKVEDYVETLNETFTNNERMNIALLLWKTMPSKSDFAQNFTYYLNEKLDKEETVIFEVPEYISNAIDFLIPNEDV